MAKLPVSEDIHYLIVINLQYHPAIIILEAWVSFQHLVFSSSPPHN